MEAMSAKRQAGHDHLRARILAEHRPEDAHSALDDQPSDKTHVTPYAAHIGVIA
jgi:hypothetical protein